jgi:esterase/lipase superfamily enzyme
MPKQVMIIRYRHITYAACWKLNILNMNLTCVNNQLVHTIQYKIDIQVLIYPDMFQRIIAASSGGYDALKHVGINKYLDVNCYWIVCTNWLLAHVTLNTYVHGMNNIKILNIR